MPKNVRDLSFLTVLARQEADCFRRGEETEAVHLAEFCERLDGILDLDGAGLRALEPSIVLIYGRALRSATGIDHKGLQELSAGLQKQITSIKDIVAKNSAGAAHEIGSPALRTTMSFLRDLHEQLLDQKRRESAKRAVNTVLRQRRE
jgi:hypothetical protein